jgi:hypothetical protein
MTDAKAQAMIGDVPASNRRVVLYIIKSDKKKTFM